jgi:hypothetical protein
VSEALFQQAKAALGDEFLTVVNQVATAGDPAVLAARAEEAEGFDRLLAEVLLSRAEGGQDLERLLSLLEAEQAEIADRVNDQLPPAWVAGRLVEEFGAALAPLLAVFAVKAQTAWPAWLISSALAYLSRVGGPAARIGMVELVATSPHRQLRSYAVEGLVALGDPAVPGLLEDKLATASEETREALRKALEAVG